MKKILIVLIIIVVGLIGYDTYEFINMQNIIKEYETKQNTYHDLLIEEKTINDEIINLNNDLTNIQNNNLDSNKDYKVWTNLIETLKTILK